MGKQNDLFLLMFSLSQLNDKIKIIRLFSESLSELFAPCRFVFSEKEPDKAPYYEEIASSETTFGYLVCDQALPKTPSFLFRTPYRCSCLFFFA
jgi:hypothetical protein